MTGKYLFAFFITGVFLTVSVVPVLAAGPSYTVLLTIRDPSHTHGAVWLNQEGGARSHVFELKDQTRLDENTWFVSIPLTTDIPPNVPWSISLPFTVWVYDTTGPHYNIYRWFYLRGDFTATIAVCYSPDPSVGGPCPEEARVGGAVLQTNPYLTLAPYLAAIGLVATAAVAVKKRRN